MNNRQPKTEPADAGRLEYINGARRQIDQALRDGLITKAQAKHIWSEVLNQLKQETETNP